MVAQTTITPRTVTASLYVLPLNYNANISYNASITYEQPGATNGSATPRAVATASANPRTVSSATMKAR